MCDVCFRSLRAISLCKGKILLLRFQDKLSDKRSACKESLCKWTAWRQLWNKWIKSQHVITWLNHPHFRPLEHFDCVMVSFTANFFIAKPLFISRTFSYVCGIVYWWNLNWVVVIWQKCLATYFRVYSVIILSWRMKVLLILVVSECCINCGVSSGIKGMNVNEEVNLGGRYPRQHKWL